ncbi:MAG: metal-dependent transcriptional regulator [Bacillota bacterium]
MGVLRERGFITKKRYGPVELTEKGRKAAEAVRKRCDLLTDLMVRVLDVDTDTARTDACRMEHAVSDETARKIDRFLRGYGGREVNGFEEKADTGR